MPMVTISTETHQAMRERAAREGLKLGAMAERAIRAMLGLSSVNVQEAAPTVAQQPNHTPKPN